MWAYAQQGNKTGEIFAFRWIDGKLNIYRARRNPVLWQFGDLILTSTSVGSTPQS